MNQAFEFLVHHGYTVLFLWVFVEQLGVPFPATPLLLAAGALAGLGQLSLPLSIGVAVVGACWATSSGSSSGGIADAGC